MSELPQKIYCDDRFQDDAMPNVLVDPSILDLVDGHLVAIDVETTGLHWWSDNLIGLGIYCKELGICGYIPTLDQASRAEVKERFYSLSSLTRLIGHNLKFDLHFLGRISRKWDVNDSMIMAHLYDSRMRKNLANCEKVFLGTNSKRAHVEGAPARKKIWEWPLEVVSRYCVNDSIVCHQLYDELIPKLKEWGLLEVFAKDMRFFHTVFDSEVRGVMVNIEFVEWAANRLDGHVTEMAERLFDACGNTFNWHSPKQLSAAIYGGLGIPKPKNPFADADGIDRSRFADAGKYKSFCTAGFLLTEKVKHPLGHLIVSMREADKLKKSYLKWFDLMDEHKVLHTSFNITGTKTGRLSSSKPNLQNIASKTRGRFTQSVYTGDIERQDEYNMRKGIIPRPGNLFMCVDYKQMEMRMFGILSKDPFMLKSLLEGKDVHLEIALKVWGDCGHESNMIHREWSKTISFGLIYGMTLGSLMYKLDMTRHEAAKVTDQYWGEFPRIKPWMDEVINSCKTSGYLRYWSGRIWRETEFRNMYRGCNAIIQGGCADFLSIASMRVDDLMYEFGDSYLVSFIHDETMCEIPADKILRSSRGITEKMEAPDLVDVPFATETKVGTSYGDLVKIPPSIIHDTSIHELSLKKIESIVNPEKKVVEETTEL